MARAATWTATEREPTPRRALVYWSWVAMAISYAVRVSTPDSPRLGGRSVSQGTGRRAWMGFGPRAARLRDSTGERELAGGREGVWRLPRRRYPLIRVGQLRRLK